MKNKSQSLGSGKKNKINKNERNSDIKIEGIEGKKIRKKCNEKRKDKITGVKV